VLVKIQNQKLPWHHKMMTKKILITNTSGSFKELEGRTRKSLLNRFAENNPRS
jgi:hypothetical protein